MSGELPSTKGEAFEGLYVCDAANVQGISASFKQALTQAGRPNLATRFRTFKEVAEEMLLVYQRAELATKGLRR